MNSETVSKIRSFLEENYFDKTGFHRRMLLGIQRAIDLNLYNQKGGGNHFLNHVINRFNVPENLLIENESIG